MKLTMFDRRKHIESLNKLKKRNAPSYVIDAYNEGYVKVVNTYYSLKLQKLKENKGRYTLKEAKAYTDYAKLVEYEEAPFIREAVKKSDIDFLKAFFQMTNMDIMSGEKLPPNAGSLLKQGIIKDLGLKDLYKKLR